MYMHEKNHQIGHLFLIFVVLTWGANYGIVKLAYQDLHPILFAAIRFTICGALVLFFTYKREKEFWIRKGDIKKVAMVGILGVGVYQILWSLGLNMTSATNSSIVLATSPLWGALYIDLFQKESVKRKQYLYMLLALFGVILVILKPTARLHFSMETLLGDLLTLMAAFCTAIFLSVWSKPLLKLYSPMRLMGYCMAIGALTLWTALPFFTPSVVLDQIGTKVWWSLGYGVILSGVIGHVFWYEGIGRIGVTKSMVYLHFIPLWAVLFNALWMGEKIYPQQILGGILILLGVHLVLRSS